MLTGDQVAAFHRDGFLNGGHRVLSEDQLTALRDSLDAVMQGRAEGQAEALRNLAGGELDAPQVVVQIVNIWEADSLFRAHLCHPAITSMVAELCATDTLRVWHDQIQYKPPVVGTATGWHQDYQAWPVLEPADLVSCWVALDDATLENGCMRMVPGSHRWGVHSALASGSDFEPVFDANALPEEADVEVVPCEVRAGCAMFHHCLTWHGSAPNPSPRPRRAIAVHYMPGHTRYVPRGGHLVEHRVEVQPGEILQGRYFPTVFRHGHPVRPEELDPRREPVAQA